MDLETILRRTTAVEKVVDPIIDLGNLLIIDQEPFNEDTTHTDEDLIRRARENAQFLYNKIWELPKERKDDAIVVELPPTTYRIPREKPVPVPRPPTKWEEYAKLKGIVSQKKSKKVFDEVSGEWKPRWGYGRANDNTKDWLIEIPDQKDPYKDYYEERESAKKERVAKNEVQRIKNITRQMQAAGKGKEALDHISLGVAKPAEERDRQELRVISDRTKVATASVGKFQEKLKLEKPNSKKGIKRQFEPNIGKLADEKSKQLQLLDKIGKKKEQFINDKLIALGGGTVEKKERKDRKGEKMRQKNQINRQKYFDHKLEEKEKTRGGGRKVDGKRVKNVKGVGLVKDEPAKKKRKVQKK